MLSCIVGKQDLERPAAKVLAVWDDLFKECRGAAEGLAPQGH